MAPDSTLRRIGIVDQSFTGWTAAALYSRMLLRSLGAACDDTGIELYFLSLPASDAQSPGQSNAKSIELTPVEYFPGERQFRGLVGLGDKSRPFRGESRLRNLLRLSDKSDLFSVAHEYRIDVLLPLLDVAPWTIHQKTIGWVPDFQHVYLPEFFNQAELDRRNNTIHRLAERATLVVLSSSASRDDFVAFAPQHAHKARVVSFPSLLAFETLDENPVATLDKFRLPEKFALLANQFWAHKNHIVVVRALDLLQKKGIDIPVVMTGLPADQRDPSNRNLSFLLQAIASAGLNSQISILGLVPYPDLINLMRTAALIIQPSRFEGWSTVVQDAKALGRPVLCSDIPVHHEQAPGALGFFACDDAAALAGLLAANWKGLQPGPNVVLEGTALAAERDSARCHGQALLKVCREACG